MKNFILRFGRLQAFCQVAPFVVSVFSAGAAPSTELYNLDFTGTETGVYQVINGNPSVQSSVGTLNDALVFQAQVGGDQIRLPIGQLGTRYEIQCDVLTHHLIDSDYAFSVRLDAAAVSSLSFHGGLDSIYVFQNSPFVNQTLAPFSNDAIYHIGISVNLEDDVWSVALDGTTMCTNPLNGASLQAVRFGLAPWIGGAGNAPDTFVALDNVLVTVIPEPSSLVLLGAGLFLWLGRTRIRTKLEGMDR